MGQRHGRPNARWSKHIAGADSFEFFQHEGPRSGRQIGDLRFGEPLLRKRRRLDRERLRGPALLAGDFGLWHRSFLDREERFARFPIEQKKMSDFRDLRKGIQLLAVVLDRHEVRRTRDVIVPQIMMHDLEMPDALARVGSKRQHAIREEVLADTIAAPMIVGS